MYETKMERKSSGPNVFVWMARHTFVVAVFALNASHTTRVNQQKEMFINKCKLIGYNGVYHPFRINCEMVFLSFAVFCHSVSSLHMYRITLGPIVWAVAVAVCCCCCWCLLLLLSISASEWMFFIRSSSQQHSGSSKTTRTHSHILTHIQKERKGDGGREMDTNTTIIALFLNFS